MLDQVCLPSLHSTSIFVFFFSPLQSAQPFPTVRSLQPPVHASQASSFMHSPIWMASDSSFLFIFVTVPITNLGSNCWQNKVAPQSLSQKPQPQIGVQVPLTLSSGNFPSANRTVGLAVVGVTVVSVVTSVVTVVPLDPIQNSDVEQQNYYYYISQKRHHLVLFWISFL